MMENEGHAQLTTYFRAPSNFFPHHYLGRTIILGGNSMETSFGEWPNLLEWKKSQYDYSECGFYSQVEDEWFYRLDLLSIDKFADMEQRYLRYWDKMYDGSY